MEARSDVRGDADDAVVGSSKRTVFCGKLAVVGCGRVNPVDVAPAVGLPKVKLPKPGVFAPSPPALEVVAGAFVLHSNIKQLHQRLLLPGTMPSMYTCLLAHNITHFAVIRQSNCIYHRDVNF